MTPQVSRRESLGILGATVALPIVGAGDAEAARVELGPFVRREGVRGRMTGAQAGAAALCLEGVSCVFGVPGAQNNEFWDAMKARRLPYLLVTNETSASVMADAAARATGRVGVFSVIPGPGLTNALTGLGEALLDSVPVVGLVTDIDRSPEGRLGQVHSLRNAELLRPVVKQLIEVRHQAEIPGAVHQAFQWARSGEPGPVGVLIPFPLYQAVWDFDQGVPPPTPPPFDEACYQQALARLADRSRRVGIYAGLGCAAASASLIRVAEILQAPVATSVSGKGTMPDHHPLAVGWGYGKQGTRAAERAFHEVDLVLAIGVRYSEVSTANYAIPKHDTLIHVDANPQNLGKNVKTEVAVCADAGSFLDRLAADAGAIQRPPSAPLVKRIRQLRESDWEDYSRERVTSAVDPMLFFTRLRCATDPETLFFIDVTAATHWASEVIRVPGPGRYFTPANNQSMGWAIPAAIGAQYVRPDTRVVAVSGDGCFLMSAIEMSTAARAGLPVRFYVLDDGGYHYMQMLQEPVYRRTTATEIARIDYRAFAQGVGLFYNEIPCNADLDGGIARANASPGPILTRVLISYEGREIRWLNALKSTYLQRLPLDQRVRLATRVGVRAIRGGAQND